AIAAFERLAAACPEDGMPLINAAMIYLHSREDAKTALELVDKGLELVDEEDGLIQGVMVKAEALIALGGAPRLANARETLGELATSVLGDGEALSLAELWLDAGDTARALELATRATRTPELAADAFHLIGSIHDERGDRKARAAAWQEVRARDLQVPPPPWAMTAVDFDRLAHAAIEELPLRARELLGNTPVLVEPVPSPELVDDGVDPRLLGLFSGTPLPEHSSVGGGPDLTTIHLFQRNLEQTAMD